MYHKYQRRPLARKSMSQCYSCSRIKYNSNSETCDKCGGIAKVYPMRDIPMMERDESLTKLMMEGVDVENE